MANPKNVKKPITSVIVVNTMFEDWAGSKPNAFIASGIPAPENPAIIKLTSIPNPTTSPR